VTGVVTVNERERLRVLFGLFGTKQCRGRSPVYEALSEAVRADDDLLDLMVVSAPDDQRRPSLLFAAVNLLLAADPDAELAAYYPVHGGRRPVDARLAPAFFAFGRAHRAELARLLGERSTQTNEIRRCVALRAGLRHVQDLWPGPVAVVEVGASAGLNLLFDRYQYRLGARDAVPSAVSPVTITCEIRGDADHIVGAVPEVTTRLGIDLWPVDLTDPAARAWLEAFIWPEQADDLAVLRGAIDLALASPAATVVRGDATVDTAGLIDGLTGSEPVVVFTASLLSYLGAEARHAFADQVRQAATRRRIAWIFAETPGLLAATGLTVETGLARRHSSYLIGARSYGPDGFADEALLALGDPYLRWLAPARHPADDFQWLAD